MTREVFIVCQGCHQPFPLEGIQERGIVRPLDYCTECRETLDDLLTLRDDLHTAFAQQLQTSLALHAAAFMKLHPGFKLPDA